MNPLMMSLLQGAMKGQGGGGGQQAAPGQEARDQNTNGLMQQMSVPQPGSGVTGLPALQGQMQAPQSNQMFGFAKDLVGAPQVQNMAMVLPDLRNPAGHGPVGPMAPQDQLPPGLVTDAGMADPQNFAPSPEQVNPQGGVQSVGQQPQQPQGQQTQQPAPGGQASWGDLLNMRGTQTNPNIFTRLGEGYNRGGVMGAIGLGMTDFTR